MKQNDIEKATEYFADEIIALDETAVMDEVIAGYSMEIHADLKSENTRLKAERDKAISTLSMYAPCSSCKFRKLYRDESPCNKCLLNKFYKNPPPCKSEWVWEGLEESE